jgi:hypothetical protein
MEVPKPKEADKASQEEKKKPSDALGQKSAKAETMPPSQKGETKAPDSEIKPTDGTQKKDETKPAKEPKGEEITPPDSKAKYNALYMPPVDPGTEDTAISVEKKDTIYISLLHTYITDFFENDDMRKAFGLNPHKKIGEIAIVASVKEVGAGPDFNFSDSGAKSGRVIYYSEGVHINSHLNFSNIPIYGPITYKGNPLAISLYVVELDNGSNDAMKAVLKTVSGIGQKAYPPSSPVLSVLDKVGSALLNRDSDDMELAYHFMLDPIVAEKANPPYAQLRTGNYVLIKRPDDTKEVQDGLPQDWASVVLDESAGILYKSEKDMTAKNAFTAATYLVFQIKKKFPADDLDKAERGQKLSDLIQKQDTGGSSLLMAETGDLVLSILSRDLAATEVGKQVELLESLKGKKGAVAKADQGRILTAIEQYVLAAPGDRKALTSGERNNLLLRVAKVYTPDRITPFSEAELKTQITETPEF